MSHTFFVDSHYTPFTNPQDSHEVFVGLSLWACTSGEIDRAALTDDMAPVNKVSHASAEPTAYPPQPTPCNQLNLYAWSVSTQPLCLVQELQEAVKAKRTAENTLKDNNVLGGEIDQHGLCANCCA